jgi:apolipoprotein N-acyltransferase
MHKIREGFHRWKRRCWGDGSPSAARTGSKPWPFKALISDSESRAADLTAVGLAVASGVLYSLGFCGFDQFYLAWICLVPILWALDNDTRSGLWVLGIAFLFGLVANLVTCTWLVGAVQAFGTQSLAAAVVGYVAVCAIQGLPLAAWGWLFHRMSVRGSVSPALAAPVLMVLVEWMFPSVLPYFLASSQYQQVALIQTLDLWGPLGLTFVLALSSAVLYQAMRRTLCHNRPWPTWEAVGLLILLAGDLLYGAVTIRSVDDTVAGTAGRLKVGVVQANVGIALARTDPKESLQRHRIQSQKLARQGAELIIWPESSYRTPIRTADEVVREPLLGSVSLPLVFGGTREGEGGEQYNTAFLVDERGEIQGTYDKTSLLPLAEHLPFAEHLAWLYELPPHATPFTAGSSTEPLVLGDLRLGILICVEDILPRLAREVMRHEPHLLVNITNDVWFGSTREPRIHLALATFRAVEHRRFLVRATNTGVSAVVDPVGRIVAETPISSRANLLGEVVPLQMRTLYGRLGDWVGALALVLVLWWHRGKLRQWTSIIRR